VVKTWLRVLSNRPWLQNEFLYRLFTGQVQHYWLTHSCICLNVTLGRCWIRFHFVHDVGFCIKLRKHDLDYIYQFCTYKVFIIQHRRCFFWVAKYLKQKLKKKILHINTGISTRHELAFWTMSVLCVFLCSKLIPTKDLRPKRRSSPCIFQVVASIHSFLIIATTYTGTDCSRSVTVFPHVDFMHISKKEEIVHQRKHCKVTWQHLGWNPSLWKPWDYVMYTLHTSIKQAALVLVKYTTG
jgi:hypothetical protein